MTLIRTRRHVHYRTEPVYTELHTRCQTVNVASNHAHSGSLIRKLYSSTQLIHLTPSFAFISITVVRQTYSVNVILIPNTGCVILYFPVPKQTEIHQTQHTK